MVSLQWYAPDPLNQPHMSVTYYDYNNTFNNIISSVIYICVVAIIIITIIILLLFCYRF